MLTPNTLTPAALEKKVADQKKRLEKKAGQSVISKAALDVFFTKLDNANLSVDQQNKVLAGAIMRARGYSPTIIVKRAYIPYRSFCKTQDIDVFVVSSPVVTAPLQPQPTTQLPTARAPITNIPVIRIQPPTPEKPRNKREIAELESPEEPNAIKRTAPDRAATSFSGTLFPIVNEQHRLNRNKVTQAVRADATGVNSALVNDAQATDANLLLAAQTLSGLNTPNPKV